MIWYKKEGHEKRHSRLLNFFVFITTIIFDEKIGCQDGHPQVEMRNKHFSTVEPLFDSISDQDMMMNTNILVMKNLNLDQRHEMN